MKIVIHNNNNHLSNNKENVRASYLENGVVVFDEGDGQLVHIFCVGHLLFDCSSVTRHRFCSNDTRARTNTRYKHMWYIEVSMLAGDSHGWSDAKLAGAVAAPEGGGRKKLGPKMVARLGASILFSADSSTTLERHMRMRLRVNLLYCGTSLNSTCSSSCAVAKYPQTPLYASDLYQ